MVENARDYLHSSASLCVAGTLAPRVQELRHHVTLSPDSQAILELRTHGCLVLQLQGNVSFDLCPLLLGAQGDVTGPFFHW